MVTHGRPDKPHGETRGLLIPGADHCL